MVPRAFQNQTRRAVSDRALEAHADLLARSQVSTGQRVGVFEIFRCAVKNNLATVLTRARAHVNHSVSSEHHSRVMLHHHQRIAGITQTVHGLRDAVHIARVQTDGGLVQHKQSVDE